jgi:AcrR family transcriptional regulator
VTTVLGHDDTSYRRLDKAIDSQKVYAAFLSVGYDQMSLKEMAEHIWMPVDQLWARYPSKYDLWYAALCQASQDLSDAINAQMTATDPLKRLRQACYATINYGLRYPNTCRFVTMPQPKEIDLPESPAPGVIAFTVLFRRLIKQCIKEGIFAERPPELVTQALISVLNSVTELEQNAQRITWSNELTTHIIETYLAGLRFDNLGPQLTLQRK